MTTDEPYDALLLVSFGGPESVDEVVPYLDGILKGKQVPESRRRAVEEKYLFFNGKSPLNDQCRELLRMFCQEEMFFRQRNESPPLKKEKGRIPVYWGNLHWKPTLQDTVSKMTEDGIRRPLIFTTSPFGSLTDNQTDPDPLTRILPGSMCPGRIPPYDTDPLFLRVSADRLLDVLARATLDVPLSEEDENRHSDNHCPDNGKPAETLLLFSAHSIPERDARRTRYVERLCQYYETLIKMTHFPAVPIGERPVPPLDAVWSFGWQSRSGRPSDPWLGPDVREIIDQFHRANRAAKRVIVYPAGFLLENMETVYDLDEEVRICCERNGLRYYRAVTPGPALRIVELCRQYLWV